MSDYRELVSNGLVEVVEWIRLLVEATGTAIIALGIVIAIRNLARALATHGDPDFNPIRLSLARYLALALEFQLGADILSTAVAPSWERIGKLGAIAVIRTALNFFLTLELRQEGQRETEREHAVSGANPSDAPSSR